MSAMLAVTAQDIILERAIRAAQAAGLPHAGLVAPVDAWSLVEAGRGVLVDVRSSEERRFVGHVPGSLHVPWATGLQLTRNPGFLRELEAKAGRYDTLLMICRSGKRSALAAADATRIGFTGAFVVLEGFEGDLDEAHRRGTAGGWRFHGLQWIQD